MEYGNLYYQWPHAGWWTGKELIAKKMSDYSLNFAMKDCFDAGQAMPENQMKYTDESSIYRMEMNRRNQRRAS